MFLEKALGQLYKNVVGPKPIVHAICAVVNKLPAAKPLHGDDVAQEAEHRAINPPINETGFEGIAYVTLPAKAELSAMPKMGGELGCIDFLAHTHTVSQGRQDDRVRVPLANTVFQTGQLSTLINSTWERCPDGDGFQMRTRKERKTAVINLSKEDPKPPNSPQTHIHQEAPALSIPLIPLTFPRQVDGHMGNIIRGVIGPDGERITASTELEQVVPQYFKSRGEPAQATSAWALVIPKRKARYSLDSTKRLLRQKSADVLDNGNPEVVGHLPKAGQHEEPPESWQAFWQKDPPLWNANIQNAIASGARLHRVLSGGGGWGKKAGLLSLDPVPFGAPVPEKERSTDPTSDTFDSVDDFSTALKPVCRDGDFIQFFVSPGAGQTEDTSTFEHLKTLERSASGRAWSWEFGVVPSTVDLVPGGSWQHTTAASQDIVVFRGSFGALTEGGLTLMRGRRTDTKTGLAQPLGSTMIDAPFSRWSAVRLFPKKELQARATGSKSVRLDLGRGPKTNTEGKLNVNTDAGNPS